jgi:hypothetical protein
MARKIIVTTFATKGPPSDQGLPIADECFDRFRAACLSGGADAVHTYTPASLVAAGLNPDAVKDWGPDAAMSHKPGYEKCGLGAWRFEIMRHHVAQANEGDVIAHLDCNLIKYPQIETHFAANIKVLAEKMLLWHSGGKTEAAIAANEDSRNMARLKDFCRLEVINRFGADENGAILQCNFVVARVCDETRRFLPMFTQITLTEPDLLFPHHERDAEESARNSRFSHHTAEQSLFNVVLQSSQGITSARSIWNRVALAESGTSVNRIEFMLSAPFPPHVPSVEEAAKIGNALEWSTPRPKPAATKRVAVAFFGQPRFAREGATDFLANEDFKEADVFWHQWGDDSGLRATIDPRRVVSGVQETPLPLIYEAAPPYLKRYIDWEMSHAPLCANRRYKMQSPLSQLYSVASVARMVASHGIAYDAVFFLRTDCVPREISNFREILEAFASSAPEIKKSYAHVSPFSDKTMGHIMTDVVTAVPGRHLKIMTSLFSKRLFSEHKTDAEAPGIPESARAFSLACRDPAKRSMRILCSPVWRKANGPHVLDAGFGRAHNVMSAPDIIQAMAVMQTSGVALDFIIYVFTRIRNERSFATPAVLEAFIARVASILSNMRRVGSTGFTQANAFFVESVYRWWIEHAPPHLVTSPSFAMFLDEASLVLFFMNDFVQAQPLMERAVNIYPNDKRLAAILAACRTNLV